MQRSYKQQSAQIRETVLVRTIESTLDKDAALLQATQSTDKDASAPEHNRSIDKDAALLQATESTDKDDSALIGKKSTDNHDSACSCAQIRMQRSYKQEHR